MPAVKKAPASPEIVKPQTVNHPKYSEMILNCITDSKERNGTSRMAIVKYIVSKYGMDEASTNSHVKRTLRTMLEKKEVIHSKTTMRGVSGSFKIPKAGAASSPKKSVKRSVSESPKKMMKSPKKALSPTKPKPKTVKK